MVSWFPATRCGMVSSTHIRPMVRKCVRRTHFRYHWQVDKVVAPRLSQQGRGCQSRARDVDGSGYCCFGFQFLDSDCFRLDCFLFDCFRAGQRREGLTVRGAISQEPGHVIRVVSSRDRGLIVRDVISEEAGPNLPASSPHRVSKDTEGTQRKWMRERGNWSRVNQGRGGGTV